MKTELLNAMLGKVAKKSGGGFTFASEATVIVEAGGTMLSVERVIKIAWDEAGFLDLQTARDERFLLDAESVCGLKLGKKAASDGAGFVAG